MHFTFLQLHLHRADLHAPRAQLHAVHRQKDQAILLDPQTFRKNISVPSVGCKLLIICLFSSASLRRPLGLVVKHKDANFSMMNEQKTPYLQVFKSASLGVRSNNRVPRSTHTPLFNRPLACLRGRTSHSPHLK